MTSLVLIGTYRVEVSTEERRFVTEHVTGDADLTELELAALALLEVSVEGAASDFEVGYLQQEGSDQAPWIERYFSADGESYLGEMRPSLPAFRVCFFLHYFQAGVAIRSPFGNLATSSLTAMPARLRAVCVYEHPG